MRQLPLAIGGPAPRTFANLLAGTNGSALEHLQALGSASPPVYLWGPSGSGKTHLLQALVNRLAANGGLAGWFAPEISQPWAYDDRWALVVIDGCDRLDAGQQHAAFSLFVQATSVGTPVAAAGRLPPIDLAVREDLRTRLGWGHVFAVAPLAEAEVRASLRQEADARGLMFSDEVMGYLLTRFARDLKHLMALLDRLDDFSLATHRPVTVPLLKQMLAEDARP